MKSRWGLGRSLAMIALIVQAPRLILSILDADQIAIQPSVRQTLLIIAAIGTASILTGGQLYLIHVIGTVRKWRPGLVIIWLGVLTFSGAMIIPAVFGGLSSTLLPSVLSLEQKLWWSLIAAMSHELTAAGCVLASIAHDRDRGNESGLSEDDLLLKVTTERNELEDRVRELERAKSVPLISNVREAEETAARLVSTFTPRVQDTWDRDESIQEYVNDLQSSPTLALSLNSQPHPVVSPYPFPCLRCGGSIQSPADAFNHSKCGGGQ